MNRRLIFFAWILPVLGVIFLGIVTRSFWICLLTLTGLLALNSGLDANVAKKRQQFFVKALVGLVLVGVATWLGNLQGPWIWTFIWILAAFFLLAAGLRMFTQAPQWSVYIALTASALCVIFAILIPFVSYGQLTPPPLPLLLVLLVLFGGAFLFFNARNKGIRSKSVLVVAFSLLLVVTLVLAYATHNILGAALTFVGIVLLFKDLNRIAEGAIHKYRRFFFSSLIGLILIGIATWLDKMQGGWIWAPIWILAAVPLCFGAAPMLYREDKPQLDTKGMAWTSMASLVVSVLCVLFAIAGPSMLIAMSPSKAVLTYLLLTLALFFVIHAWSVTGAGKSLPFVIFGFLGTVLLAAAAFYAQIAGRWVWTFFWLFAALLTAEGARRLLKITKSAGAYGVTLSLLNAVFAVIGPLYGASYIETVKSIFNRQAEDDTIFKLAAVGMIPLVLLILGVVGIFLIVRIHKAIKAKKAAPRSQTPTLDLLLSTLDSVQKKHKKK